MNGKVKTSYLEANASVSNSSQFLVEVRIKAVCHFLRW